MTNEHINKTKWLHLRLSQKEYDKIKKHFEKTTCRNLSQYARNVVLQKPVIIKHRNQSLDDFMTVLIDLRKELNSIGNNLNQTVKKLHTLQSIEEFRNWHKAAEMHHQIVIAKTEEIKSRINQISSQWLQ